MQYIDVIYGSLTNIFEKCKYFSVHEIVDFIKNKLFLFFHSKSFLKQSLIKNNFDENTKKNMNPYNKYYNSNKKAKCVNFNIHFSHNCNCINNCNYKCDCDWGWLLTLDV